MGQMGTMIIAGYAVVITLVFLWYLIFRKRQQDKHYYAYQDKILKEQMEEMNGIYMTMRGWRHDYHNHMQTIKAHLETEQVAEATGYLDRMEDALEQIDFEYKTGNIGVDAILNSKLSIAKKHNMEIKCDAVLSGEITIPQIDLCVLLGNLVDNAIEACDKMEEGQRKFLRIYMCIRQSQLYISVANATNEVIRKLDKDYISNKRGNHGHGLKRINLIVEKHSGYINRQNEPGVFVTEVMLPLAH